MNNFNILFDVEGDNEKNTGHQISPTSPLFKTMLAMKVDNYHQQYEAGSQEALTKDLSRYQMVHIINTAMHLSKELAKETIDDTGILFDDDYDYAIDSNCIGHAIQVLGRLESESYYVNKYPERDTSNNLLDKLLQNRKDRERHKRRPGHNGPASYF